MRAKPFWSLNGSLEEEELKRQIGIMAEMGFGGAYLHSRTGLSTEYLSEEWFRLMNICADELKSHGMCARLYDEDRYPSGVAGGYVTMEPSHRGQYLTVRVVPAEELTPEEGDIAAFSVEFKRGRMVRFSPYGGEGRGSVAVFSVREREAQDVYNGYSYFDALKKEATDAFLHITLDKYAEKMGERIGGSVDGVFTDEPNRGAVFNGFAHIGADAERRAPYTEALFPAYFEKWGERLEEHLPELYFRGKESFSRTAWRYMETLTSLFLENYAKPYKEWCDSHGVAFTGHILHEDNLSAMTTLCGSPMRFYEYMDIPGVDNLTADSTNIAVPLMAASVARQCGKRGVLSEMYAVIGWQADFTTYKRIGDWHAFFGVNDRCTHLSMYTMSGIAKRDYPASILHQSVWWKDYRAVEDYFARLNVFLAKGKREAQLLWIHPVESAWGMGRMEGYNNCFVPKDRDYLALETRYWRVSNLLADRGVAFDFGDEEMMSRLARVSRTKEGAALRVGNAVYPKVLLAGNVTLRSSTVALLQKFMRAGGEVLAVGDLPKYRDGEHFSAKRCLKGVKCVEAADLPAAVSLPFTMKGGKAYTHVASEGRRLYFAAVSVEKEAKAYEFTFDGRYSVKRCDARTGKIAPFAADFDGTMTKISAHLDAGEEILLVLTKNEAPMSATCNHVAVSTAETLAADGEYPYLLKEPNVCVLDFAAYSVNDKTGHGEILRVDDELRDALGLPRRTPEAIQPWFRKKFGMVKPCGAQTTLRFSFRAEYLPPALTLVWEPIRGAKVSLNGVAVESVPRASDWDSCFAEPVLPRLALHKGENVIEVAFPMEEDTPVEAMYLKGRFGVRVDGHTATLCRLKKSLHIGDISGQGLPFYSGELCYRIPHQAGNYHVSLGRVGGALVRIQGKTLPFRPFAADVHIKDRLEISVMITQRNKFGPSHFVGESRGAFGEFCPPPEQYSEDYRLIEQGLLEVPVIRNR